MKKKTLVSAILAASIMGSASVTMAAENMFSDVPLEHWAYDAVAKLAQDGIIEGYGDTNFEGGQPITRYEMAQLVAKAMANQENARAVDKAAIEKLQKEFDSELKGEVENLRKDVNDLKSRMGWYGDARMRYFANKDMKSLDKNDTKNWAGTDRNNSQFEKRVRLGFWANPAENLSVDGRIKYEDNSYSEDIWNDKANGNFNTWDNSYRNQNSLRLDKMSLKWNNADTTYVIGRNEVSLGQGLVWWENPIDGAYVEHKFGDKVTAMVGVGDISAEGWQDSNMTAQYANVKVQTSPATTITLAGMHTNSKLTAKGTSYAYTPGANQPHEVWNGGSFVGTGWVPGPGTVSSVTDEADKDYRLNQISLGINTQLSDKWNLIVEGVHNNVGETEANPHINKNGLWVRATYGKLKWDTANTWNVYGEYFALGNAAVDSRFWGHRLNIAGGNSNWGGGNNSWGDGARGWGLGAAYQLAKNTNFEITGYFLKPYDEAAAGFGKYQTVGYAALTYSF